MPSALRRASSLPFAVGNLWVILARQRAFVAKCQDPGLGSQDPPISRTQVDSSIAGSCAQRDSKNDQLRLTGGGNSLTTTPPPSSSGRSNRGSPDPGCARG